VCCRAERFIVGIQDWIDKIVSVFTGQKKRRKHGFR
jgi:hypothetical protein